MAQINYQVPPLSALASLRVELSDPTGKRDILNSQVESGENVRLRTLYNQECLVSIYLNEELVWQEKYQ